MFCDVICPRPLEITIPTFNSEHPVKILEFFLAGEIDLVWENIPNGSQKKKRINMLSVEFSILMAPL